MLDKNISCCIITKDTENLRENAEKTGKILENGINRAISHGKRIFITGLANQIDIWAANIILELREKDSEIKLFCAIPYFGFEKTMEFIKRCAFYSILSEAEETFFVSGKEDRDFIDTTNKWMIECSSEIIEIE